MPPLPPHYEAALEYEICASSPDPVNVDGFTAKPGKVALSVTDINFSAVVPGEQQQQTVTVTNSGDLDVALPPITLSGNAAFSLESDPCADVTLAAANCCSFAIAFAPAALGDASRQVTVNPIINVSGTGAFPALFPSLPLLPMALLILLLGVFDRVRLNK